MLTRRLTSYCVWPALAICAGTVSPIHAQVAIDFERIGPAAAFFRPTALAQPPGESRRLYVIEQPGLLRMIRDGEVEPEPLLTLGDVEFGGESGLLGLAFHPQFQTNGHFFLAYTTQTAPAGTRIVRFQMDPANPETVDPATKRRILTIARNPTFVHHGGWLGFGPDGYLYIASGDGASAQRAQDIASLLGKILRIDVDGDDFPADPESNYAIPPSNPLVGQPLARGEIWAMGLRNPWRSSFDRLTGDLWISDVGGALREEVNFQPAAGAPPHTLFNYGWPCWEGTVHRPQNCATALPPFTPPVYDYERHLGVCVIGGYVYRGAAIPALRGTYLAGDWGRHMFRFRLDSVSGPQEVMHFDSPGTNRIYSLGEDEAGELYVLTPTEGVFKIVPACYANCDGSTTEPILTVDDFTCFINEFAEAQSLPLEQQIAHYANCDGSTTEPILTVDDFTCFVNAFAAGCP